MYSKNLRILFLLLLFLFSGGTLIARDPVTQRDSVVTGADFPSGDSLIMKDISLLADSSRTLTDTIPASSDPPAVDSAGITAPASSKSQAVDSPVEYDASDSIVYSISSQKVFLYGDGQIKYKSIELKADYIEFDMKNEIVFAEGAPDSVGNIVGEPEFAEGTQKFDCKSLYYNFRSKKGYITDIFSEQEGGYLHSATTKRQPDDRIHIKNGKYTTCNAPHPHFYLALTKAVSIPGDKIVSGPAYLVLEDVPLPLGVPFGFFPSTSTSKSGILMPQYGEEDRRGFYLRNGGVYLAFSQYFDLRLTGDIYTNGTWGARVATTYNKRYKFGGSFGLNYFENVSGEQGLDTYSKNKDFAVLWNHNQDPKANPNQTFRASVDFSTSSYDRNHTRNINSVLTSNKRSSISYSRVWPSTPFNFSGSMSANQNSQTQKVGFNIPQMNMNMNRIYPLRRKNRTGPKRFYEDLQVGYNSTLENRLETYEDSLRTTKWEDFDNGYMHNIPVSLNFKFLKYFNFTPNLRYTGVIFTKTIHPHFEHDYENRIGRTIDTIIIDTTSNLKYAHAYVPSFSLGVSPKIYGMYQFKESSRIEAIRHVMSPRASMSLTPDMKGKVPDYYQEIIVDTSGRTRTYSLFDETVYRTPVPSGRSGSVSLSLGNNVEMKLKPASDTIEEFKKVKLLDNLNFSTNYAIFKDSIKWSPVRMSGNTRLFKNKLSLRFGGTLNPYGYVFDDYGRGILINQSSLKSNDKLVRLTDMDFSVGMNFRSQQGGADRSGQGEIPNDPTSPAPNPSGSDQPYYDDYVDWDIPWTFSSDYSFRYSRPYEESTIVQSVRIRGDFSLTPRWKIGFNSGYDFQAKKISTTNLNIYRDLHCWEMKVSVVPFGLYRSYSFQINIKSTILRDLKYEKGDNWYDNF